MKTRLTSLLLPLVFLAGCVSADPNVVAYAVNATLTAAITPTPIVIVVTALGSSPVIPTVTPNPTATLPPPTPTLEAATETPPVSTPTPEPSPTVEPSPTPSVPPSATPPPTVATAIPLAHGAVIFEDDFTDPTLWTLANDSVQHTTIADGQFLFTIKAVDQYRFVYNSKRRAGDFVAALAASTAACRWRDRYGLLFRVVSAGNYYQFDVDCNGSFRVSKVVAGTLTPLQNWLNHGALRSGPGTNELGVRAKGKTLEVYANGELLASLTDNAFTEGGFGLYAGSGLSETYTAVFEQLSVWQLK